MSFDDYLVFKETAADKSAIAPLDDDDYFHNSIASLDFGSISHYVDSYKSGDPDHHAETMRHMTIMGDKG